MTKEEFKKKDNDIKSQIENLTKKKNDLEIEYLSHAPFKVGDKVIVYRRDWTIKGFSKEVEKVICFIRDIKIYYDKEYRYSFNKIKKDGSMSGQSASIYDYDKIELLNDDKSVQECDARKAK